MAEEKASEVVEPEEPTVEELRGMPQAKPEKQDMTDTPSPEDEGKPEDTVVTPIVTPPEFSVEEKEIIETYGFDPKTITQDELKRFIPNLKKIADERKRYYTQNHDISLKYQSQKEELAAIKQRESEKQKIDHERFQGLSEADRMREYLKAQGVDMSRFEDNFVLNDDDYLKTQYLINKSQVDAMFPAPKPVEAQPQIEGQTELTDEQKAEITKQADLVIKTINEAGHTDYEQVYGSPEFADWLKQQSPLDMAKFISQNPKDHISLISGFKAYKSAKSALSEADIEKQRKLDAAKGIGTINGGAPVSSSDDVFGDNLPIEDWMKKNR